MGDIYIKYLGISYSNIAIWKTICVTEPVGGKNLVIC